MKKSGGLIYLMLDSCYFWTDSCPCHGGLVENGESASHKYESALKNMNPPLLEMNSHTYN